MRNQYKLLAEKYAYILESKIPSYVASTMEDALSGPLNSNPTQIATELLQKYNWHGPKPMQININSLGVIDNRMVPWGLETNEKCNSS